MIFQTTMIMFYVNLQGCKLQAFWGRISCTTSVTVGCWLQIIFTWHKVLRNKHYHYMINDQRTTFAWSRQIFKSGSITSYIFKFSGLFPSGDMIPQRLYPTTLPKNTSRTPKSGPCWTCSSALVKSTCFDSLSTCSKIEASSTTHKLSDLRSDC